MLTLISFFLLMQNALPTIDYKISGYSSNLNIILIETTITNPKETASMDFVLPAWRPGRYQIQNYAANVQEFSAKNETGNLLFEKIDKQTWRVQTNKAKKITITYKYYAGAQLDAGNTYYGKDELYFNGSNVFMYTAETRLIPCTLEINVPTEWKIASQLTPSSKKNIYTAANYDELIDSPTMSTPTLTEIKTKVNNVDIIFAFATNKGLQGAKMEVNFKKDMEKIIKTQFDIMKSTPISNYTFIYHLVPYTIRHGVEHERSTSIAVGPVNDLENKYNEFLAISSHEFFHLWNIKKIIPDAFVPYDLTKEAYSKLLYISEGFTSYYENLSMLRAGVYDTTQYFSKLATLYTSLENSPAKTIQSLALSSFDAWLSGYGKGRKNSTISFYDKGELVGFLLDIEIRKRTTNTRSLDDVMRKLYTDFALKHVGFSENDFANVLKSIAGDFSDFLNKHVYTTAPTEIEKTLSYFGATISIKSEKNILGVLLDETKLFPVITEIVPNSPAEKSMLYVGDILIAINEKSLTNQSVNNIIAPMKANTEIELTVVREERILKIKINIVSTPTYSITIKKQSEEQKNNYSKWSKSL